MSRVIKDLSLSQTRGLRMNIKYGPRSAMIVHGTQNICLWHLETLAREKRPGTVRLQQRQERERSEAPRRLLLLLRLSDL